MKRLAGVNALQRAVNPSETESHFYCIGISNDTLARFCTAIDPNPEFPGHNVVILKPFIQFRTGTYIKNIVWQFDSHNIVIHIEALPYRKIPFPILVHPEMLIERDSPVFTVHVKFNPDRAEGERLDILHDCSEQFPAQTLALELRKDIELFYVIDGRLFIGSGFLISR